MKQLSAVNPNTSMKLYRTNNNEKPTPKTPIAKAETPEIKEMPKVSFGRDLVNSYLPKQNDPKTVTELKDAISSIKSEIEFDKHHPDKKALLPKIRLNHNKELLKIYKEKLAKALNKSI